MSQDLEEELLALAEPATSSKTHPLPQLKTTNIQINPNVPFVETTSKSNQSLPTNSKAIVFTFDQLLKESEHLFPSSTYDPTTRIRSNKSLSLAITAVSWLNDEHVNESMKFLLKKRNAFDKFYFCPTYYSGISITTSHAYGILGHLERFQSVKKSVFLLPFNTSIFHGAHWMLGIALIEKKTLVICNPLLSGKYSYERFFNMLIKVLRLNELLKDNVFDFSEWTFAICKDVAQQPNDFDCGVYVCFYARQILDGKSLRDCDAIKERENVQQIFSQDYTPFDPTRKRIWNRALLRGELDNIMQSFFQLRIISADSALLFSNF